MNSKGQIGDYLLTYIPRIIFLIIVLTSIFILINTYIKTEVHTFEAESNLFVQRLLYSRNCLAYQDSETGQVYPGVIDIAEVTDDGFEQRLAQAIGYKDSQHIAARISLLDGDMRELDSIFYNEKWFERWIPLTKYKGFSGSTSINRLAYVLFKDRRDVSIKRIENEIEVISQDIWARDIIAEKRAEIERLKNKPTENELLMAPGYVKVTVVMPNS